MRHRALGLALLALIGVMALIPGARTVAPVPVSRARPGAESPLPGGVARDTMRRKPLRAHATPSRAVAVTVQVVPGGTRVPVSSFSLRLAGANPTAGAAPLQFTCGRVSQVDITVLDVNGKRVATLVNGIYPPGTYRAVWNGTRDDGHPTAPGLYFIHMRSGSFESARKVVLRR